MDDEIKKILKSLKVGIDKQCISKPNFSISYNDVKNLLDYITNLQQENEKLKDTLNKIMASDGETTTPILDLIKEKEDYKSRIEKAVEYIQNHQLVFELSSKKEISQWFDIFYKDTLNILNDKE